ncbi:MAG: hypothetical protein N5P05_004102 (plasmid) [Chroococcopsis gigantea SAG 12.99]|jgi:prophage antirepressor-like protein|nr:hypothetical protein [Chroococcopsis gigantea SAG 12.99]
MNDRKIIPFIFQSSQIRVAVINNEPWFHASDVASAIGHSNPSKAVADNVSPKYNQQLDLGLPGKQPIFISEAGLYQLILRSNLPKAEPFQEWIVEEVLPSIRKTGSYSPNLTPTEILAAVAQKLVEQERQLKQQEHQIDALLSNQRKANEELSALPWSDIPAPELTTRAKLNQLVRNYVARSNASYQEVWRKLYKEMYYRCGYNAVIRAKNRNTSALDAAESDGFLDSLYSIASELLKDFEL